MLGEAQWPIGYGVGLRIKRSSVRIRPWPLRWVLGQGSLLPLSQGEAFTLASISYLAILVKYILAKKKKKKNATSSALSFFVRSEGLKRKYEVDSKQEIEKGSKEWIEPLNFVSRYQFLPTGVGISGVPSSVANGVMCALSCLSGSGSHCVFFGILSFFFTARPHWFEEKKKTNEKHRKNTLRPVLYWKLLVKESSSFSHQMAIFRHLEIAIRRETFGSTQGTKLLHLSARSTCRFTTLGGQHLSFSPRNWRSSIGLPVLSITIEIASLSCSTSNSGWGWSGGVSG